MGDSHSVLQGETHTLFNDALHLLHNNVRLRHRRKNFRKKKKNYIQISLDQKLSDAKWPVFWNTTAFIHIKINEVLWNFLKSKISTTYRSCNDI
jgi:hypothetical protein